MTSTTDSTAPQERPLALFDFDDTISIGDTMLHWQRWYLRKRKSQWMIPWIWSGCLFKAAGMSRLWFKRFYMATSNRETESSRDNLIREFRREQLSQVVHPELVERAWVHHMLGDRIHVVSASPAFLLDDLSEIFPPHALTATKLEFEGKHLWNLPRAGLDIKGLGKIEALTEAGTLPASPLSHAYSDHHSDLPLLEAVDFPVAVHPDTELHRHASSLGWQILEPITPWTPQDAWKPKATWLLLPLGAGWPGRQLPVRRDRKKLWQMWRKSFQKLNDAAGTTDRIEFDRICQELELSSAQLKGVALRMAQSLIQKPFSRHGLPDTGRMDRVWGSGLQQALTAPQIDAMRQIVVELPDFDASLVQTAPYRCSWSAQFYRAHRPGKNDGILKLFLPGIRESVATDLELHATRLSKDLPAETQRAWNGYLRELGTTLVSELSAQREESVSRTLAPLFLAPEMDIRLPWAKAVFRDGLEGVFYEAVEGYSLPVYFAYLRETRKLRDPHAQPSADFQGFASMVSRSGDLPQGRALSQRIWQLLSHSFWNAGIWIPLGNWGNATVIPGFDHGWKLGVRDLSGCLDFSSSIRDRLENWENIAEGSAELRTLCLEMGWNESQLTLHAGRWRDLIEVVWHPILYGNPLTGFAFESWRLDGRLQSLIGARHTQEEWPIPDGLRPVFRTLYWLRRNLAGILEG
jgi:phosphoserine phosphatase